MTPEDEFLNYILNGGYAPEPEPPPPSADPFVEAVFPDYAPVEAGPMMAPYVPLRNWTPIPLERMPDPFAVPALPYVPDGGGDFFVPSIPLDVSQVDDRRNEQPDFWRDLGRLVLGATNWGGGGTDVFPPDTNRPPPNPWRNRDTMIPPPSPFRR